MNFEEVVKRRTCCVALMGMVEMRRRDIRLFIGVVLSMEGSRLTLDDTFVLCIAGILSLDIFVYLCPIYLFTNNNNRFELRYIHPESKNKASQQQVIKYRVTILLDKQHSVVELDRATATTTTTPKHQRRLEFELGDGVSFKTKQPFLTFRAKKRSP